MSKDWTKLYKKYKGLWVALDKDEVTVLGYGKTANEAVKKAQIKTNKTLFLTRIPKDLASYVGVI